MDYCLINMSKELNKFFADNQFDETIIKENKNKVRSSANSILDKFLRKIVMFNIILLAKTRKIMAKKSDATNHSNYYLIVNNIVDISKLVQLLIKDGVFEKQLKQIYEMETLDLFVCRTAKMATRIPLHKDQMHTRENQNKAFSDND